MLFEKRLEPPACATFGSNRFFPAQGGSPLPSLPSASGMPVNAPSSEPLLPNSFIDDAVHVGENDVVPQKVLRVPLAHVHIQMGETAHEGSVFQIQSSDPRRVSAPGGLESVRKDVSLAFNTNTSHVSLNPPPASLSPINGSSPRTPQQQPGHHVVDAQRDGLLPPLSVSVLVTTSTGIAVPTSSAHCGREASSLAVVHSFAVDDSVEIFPCQSTGCASRVKKEGPVEFLLAKGSERIFYRGTFPSGGETGDELVLTMRNAVSFTARIAREYSAAVALQKDAGDAITALRRSRRQFRELNPTVTCPAATLTATAPPPAQQLFSPSNLSSHCIDGNGGFGGARDTFSSSASSSSSSIGERATAMLTPIQPHDLKPSEVPVILFDEVSPLPQDTRAATWLQSPQIPVSAERVLDDEGSGQERDGHSAFLRTSPSAAVASSTPTHREEEAGHSALPRQTSVTRDKRHRDATMSVGLHHPTVDNAGGFVRPQEAPRPWDGERVASLRLRSAEERPVPPSMCEHFVSTENPRPIVSLSHQQHAPTPPSPERSRLLQSAGAGYCCRWCGEVLRSIQHELCCPERVVLCDRCGGELLAGAVADHYCSKSLVLPGSPAHGDGREGRSAHSSVAIQRARTTLERLAEYKLHDRRVATSLMGDGVPRTGTTKSTLGDVSRNSPTAASRWKRLAHDGPAVARRLTSEGAAPSSHTSGGKSIIPRRRDKDGGDRVSSAGNREPVPAESEYASRKKMSLWPSLKRVNGLDRKETAMEDRIVRCKHCGKMLKLGDCEGHSMRCSQWIDSAPR